MGRGCHGPITVDRQALRPLSGTGPDAPLSVGARRGEAVNMVQPNCINTSSCCRCHWLASLECATGAAPIARPPSPPITARRPDGRVPPHFTRSVASSACKPGASLRSGCFSTPAVSLPWLDCIGAALPAEAHAYAQSESKAVWRDTAKHITSDDSKSNTSSSHLDGRRLQMTPSVVGAAHAPSGVPAIATCRR